MNFNHLLKNPFSKLKLDTSAHLAALDLPNNHLLKQILPIGVLPSALALSRLQGNTVRLYEQGASKKRIEQYWKRWLIWGFGFGIWGLTYAANAACLFPGTSHAGNCICKIVGPGPFVGAWNIALTPNGTISPPDISTNATLCSNVADTICGLGYDHAALVPWATGDTIYAKTNTGDYFKCPVTLGSNLISEAHTPTPPPTNPVTNISSTPTLYRVPFSPVPFLPIIPLIGIGVFTYVWRNKRK